MFFFGAYGSLLSTVPKLTVPHLQGCPVPYKPECPYVKVPYPPRGGTVERGQYREGVRTPPTKNHTAVERNANSEVDVERSEDFWTFTGKKSSSNTKREVVFFRFAQ